MKQLQQCPNCGTRLMPSPKEMLELRTTAGLTQRAMAALLGVKASFVAYLEAGKRHPSGDFILRYRKVEKALRTKTARTRL